MINCKNVDSIVAIDVVDKNRQASAQFDRTVEGRIAEIAKPLNRAESSDALSLVCQNVEIPVGIHIRNGHKVWPARMPNSYFANAAPRKV